MIWICEKIKYKQNYFVSLLKKLNKQLARAK